MGLQKNVSSQKVRVFAFDRTDNTPVTGDAANITMKIAKDWGTATTSNDANPTEVEDGYYLFDLTQAETDANVLDFYPQSSTADVQVIAIPGTLFTVPANFTTVTIANNAVAANTTHWSGTSVATPDTAGYPKVTLKSGTGAGELTITSGVVSATANVTSWSGTSVATPDTAGYPKVTVKAGTGTGEISLSSGGVKLSDDLYHADIQFVRDQANSTDEWTVTWLKNGVRQTAGITSPTLQLVKRADGTDLKAATAMTQIGTTGTYKLDLTSTDRVTPGEAVIAVAVATIDSGSRAFSRLVGRDSS